ncbi:hypothetical protein LJC37_04215 [Bacteroidales bacterium OttesenSCG-928-E04]|nr:hypothetical protein [Bacteroidales bacterium OttesenSCG-928-E04]
MKPLRGFVPVGTSFSMAMDALRAKGDKRDKRQETREREAISSETEGNKNG